MAAKLKKGDKVVVLAGKDKGKKARSPASTPRPAKPSSTASTWPSATPARARPARAAACPRRCRWTCRTSRYVDANGKPTRVGFRMEDGKKVRYAKTTGDVIDA
jgi:large subunit ribosomal protein L24